MWWVNSQATDQISVADRGLAYGDGLFETMRVIQNRIPLMDAHLHRLASGAERLGLDFSIAEVKKAIEQAVYYASENGWQQSVVKLILTRSGASAGYRAETESSANVLVRISELLIPEKLPALRVKLCDYKLSTQPALAGIKHLNRLEQVLASQELDDEDEGILLDSRGYLAEGISGNVFLVHGSEISTPKMVDLGVKGVMRDFLIQQIPLISGASSMRLKERDILPSELNNADELLLTNAVRGVRNIDSVTGIWSSSNRVIGDRLRSLLCEKLDSDFRSELAGS